MFLLMSKAKNNKSFFKKKCWNNLALLHGTLNDLKMLMGMCKKAFTSSQEPRLNVQIICNLTALSSPL